MSDPIPPDERTPETERAWFRAQVDPVLDAEPIDDAWAAIEARSHGDVPAEAATHATPRRWFAIAAVLAVLAGLAVVVATTRPDDTTTIRANEPEGTGWYIPANLPEGWTLRSAWITKRPSSCGHVMRQWRSETSGAELELTYTPCASKGRKLELPVGASGPSLGHGIDDTVLEESTTGLPIRQLHWIDDGGWSLVSRGALTRDDLIEAAKAIVDHPASTTPPIEGLVFSGSGFGNGPLPGPAVAVSLETPSGQIASYRLAAPGTGPQANPFTRDTPVEVPGQPLPVELRTPRYDDPPDGIPGLGEECCAPESSYLGDWPGADLQVTRSNFSSDAAGPMPTSQAEWDAYDDSLVDLIGFLRPATTAEWRAFLATAAKPPSERLLGADELTDVSTTKPADAATTTTTAPKTTTTTDPDDGVRSARGTYPATPVARANEDDRLTSLDDLEISLEIEDIHDDPGNLALAVGEVAPAKLIVHNTSDEPVVLTECTLAFTRWGLVPASDRNAPLPDANDAGCSAFPEETIPARGTIRLPFEWSQPAGFVAQRPAADGSGRFLGALPQGAYFATVEVPGRASDVRLQIPVEVPEPPCPASDEDVEDYLGLPRSQAQALAKQRGRTLGMATLDGDAIAPPGDEVRCDRVNVDVWLSAVVNAYIR